MHITRVLTEGKPSAIDHRYQLISGDIVKGYQMKTIAFVATKGGTGKSSLCFGAGIEAAKRGSVYFVDMDPQRSLTEICARRGGNSTGNNPALLGDVKSLPEAIATLKRTHFERDYLLVDTPGSLMKVIRDAIAVADCIILPVQQSPLDILAQDDAVQLILEAGKQAAAFFVMNRIQGAAKTGDLAARIKTAFPNPPVKIAQRLIYANALINGQSAAEIDSKAADEMALLWAAIDKILQR
jgi:chromosome partitioning protein